MDPGLHITHIHTKSKTRQFLCLRKLFVDRETDRANLQVCVYRHRGITINGIDNDTFLTFQIGSDIQGRLNKNHHSVDTLWAYPADGFWNTSSSPTGRHKFSIILSHLHKWLCLVILYQTKAVRMLQIQSNSRQQIT